MTEHYTEGWSDEGERLRCVLPYDFSYTTWCKERWRDRLLMEIFTKEFKAYSAEYYAEAISTGAVRVNGEIVGDDYVIRNGDCILHTTVRNEPPVLFIPPHIKWDLPHFIVVNKPPSIPVHSCGAYHKNSLLGILELEFGMKNLKPIHRLDRVTSGIVILAKTSDAARSLTEMMKEDSCVKEYVARVKGRFPYLKTTVDVGISCKSQKDGVYFNDPKGKPSVTEVEFWKYDRETDTSLVWARPLTGRTHQIRLHLQHLGFPIANDSCYGGQDMQPLTLSDTTYKRVKLEIGDKRIHLEESRQVSIWLHAHRYRLSQNLDFSVDLPLWTN